MLAISGTCRHQVLRPFKMTETLTVRVLPTDATVISGRVGLQVYCGESIRMSGTQANYETVGSVQILDTRLKAYPSL